MDKEKKVTFSMAIAVVLLLIIVGFIIDLSGGLPKIITDFLQLPDIDKINIFIALSGVVMLLLKIRTFIVKILTSLKFAVVTLVAIALFTILGTLILQNESYENYINIYNKNLVDFFYKLHLTDIFHSYYFTILLFILAISLALVIANSKPFKLTQIGSTLTHGGVIVILIGALIGGIFGEKGFISLIKGEKPTNTMIILKNGKEVGRKIMDFSMALDDFTTEYYYEDMIYVYEKDKEEYKYILGVDPAKTREFQLPGGIRTIRLLNKNIYESKEKRIKIPYFKIEVETPKDSNITRNTDKNSPHHGLNTGTNENPIQLVLLLGLPLPFDNNKYVLVYEPRKEPKLFKSIISIYENNEKKLTFPLLVNSPFTYKSYKFYQADYNPENPNYSGIIVVKDPGLFLVYLGFIIMCSGIIYIFYIKPKIVEKMQDSNSQLQSHYLNTVSYQPLVAKR